MNKWTCCAALVALLAVPASQSWAQTLNGKWGGKSPSTLEFLDGKQVKYCFLGKCTVQPYTGDNNQKIEFNWGPSEFTFTKTATGYDGTYRLVQTSTIKME